MKKSFPCISTSLKAGLVILCLVSILLTWVQPAKANGNLMDSPKFGYGARIDPWGKQIDFALESLSTSNLDWLGIDFDWERYWHDRNTSLDLSNLDRIMSFARQQDIKVLLSVTNPPAWVITDRGPDVHITSGLVAQLVRLYPEVLTAIELFPAANTREGWGIHPDARAYTDLLQAVSELLLPTNTGLVAAGLTPVDTGKQPADIDDVSFLSQLYTFGAAKYMPIVGVRLPILKGDPLDAPWGGDPFSLRHYEMIRNEMLNAGHSDGAIWITGFALPTEYPDIQHRSAPHADLSTDLLAIKQSYWLNQAFYLMRSQLYVGAAFFSCLNPPSLDHRDGQLCLIQVNGEKPYLHLAYTDLSRMIVLENNFHAQLNGSAVSTENISSLYPPMWSSP